MPCLSLPLVNKALLAAALHQAALERKWEDGKLVSCLILTFATFGKPLMSHVTQDSIL